MILVIGGSGSGKSRYAEEIIVQRTEGKKYYLATMRPEGKEAGERIARHRRMRAGKGFLTLEAAGDLPHLSLPAGAAALLECVGNLLANEMFGAKKGFPDHQLCCRLTRDILCLDSRCKELIVVSNDVFSSGECYTGETMRYVGCLGQINRQLAARADCVVEVVCGIPCAWKGELP